MIMIIISKYKNNNLIEHEYASSPSLPFFPLSLDRSLPDLT